MINHSLGGHSTSHQGDAEEEQILNNLIKNFGPGLAVTVSAGNDGQYSFHGAGRFGPYRKGQADVEGDQLEVVISARRTKGVAPLQAYFNPEDEWGLAIEGAESFLVDEKGNPLLGYVYKRNNQINLQFIRVTKTDGKLVNQRAELSGLPKIVQEWAQYVLSTNNAELTKREGNYDCLTLPLLDGSFRIWGFGVSEKVKSGAFDVYLPLTQTGGFTIGAIKKQMVGSPGNAAEVITVGAYDFRSEWINREGKLTRYNLQLGGISDYSSPGGPRAGGVYKPEIAAPATYTISSLSQAATSAKGGCGPGAMGNALGNGAITSDGYHIAWQGTSASAPYVAGVIALMLQKNPNLTNAQIKQILIRTVTKGDSFVGATQNPEWGYGRINPAAALAATPGRKMPKRK